MGEPHLGTAGRVTVSGSGDPEVNLSAGTSVEVSPG